MARLGVCSEKKSKGLFTRGWPRLIKEKIMKNNFVAKNAHKFNKSVKHKDRKKAHKRGELKHRGAKQWRSDQLAA